jgi:hypothetical protein
MTPKLAAALKRYEARQRQDTTFPHLLISEHGQPYKVGGIDSMMDRLQVRVGFRVHTHALRTRSGRWPQSSAGTLSISAPRWVTPTTRFSNATCAWPRSATWDRG